MGAPSERRFVSCGGVDAGRGRRRWPCPAPSWGPVGRDVGTRTSARRSAASPAAGLMVLGTGGGRDRKERLDATRQLRRLNAEHLLCLRPRSAASSSRNPGPQCVALPETGSGRPPRVLRPAGCPVKGAEPAGSSAPAPNRSPSRSRSRATCGSRSRRRHGRPHTGIRAAQPAAPAGRDASGREGPAHNRLQDSGESHLASCVPQVGRVPDRRSGMAAPPARSRPGTAGRSSVRRCRSTAAACVEPCGRRRGCCARSSAARRSPSRRPTPDPAARRPRRVPSRS